MSESIESNLQIRRSHDETPEGRSRDVGCPKLVKVVTSVVLLIAGVNFFASWCHSQNAVLASLAFVKGVIGVAAGLGLLKLKNGWRILVLFTTGLSILVLLFYFLAVVLSSKIASFVSQLSGIDSRTGISLILALGFIGSLWMFKTLLHPDVEKAFAEAP
jgi:hypothetical protein